jgi:hypothetical protein
VTTPWPQVGVLAIPNGGILLAIPNGGILLAIPNGGILLVERFEYR